MMLAHGVSYAGVNWRRDWHHPSDVNAERGRQAAFHTSNQPPLCLTYIIIILFPSQTNSFLILSRPSSCIVPTTPWSTLSKRSSAISFSPTNTSNVQVSYSIFILMTFSTHSGMHLFAVNYTLEGESKLASNSRSFQPLLPHLPLQETLMKTCQGDTVAPFNPLDCRCHWTSPSCWVPGDSHWSLCIS